MEDVGGGAVALWRLGGLAALQGRAPEPAAQLLGASEVFRERIGAIVPPCDRREYERAVSEAKAGMHGRAFKAAWKTGRGLELSEAARLGLCGDTLFSARAPQPGRLTAAQ